MMNFYVEGLVLDDVYVKKFMSPNRPTSGVNTTFSLQSEQCMSEGFNDDRIDLLNVLRDEEGTTPPEQVVWRRNSVISDYFIISAFSWARSGPTPWTSPIERRGSERSGLSAGSQLLFVDDEKTRSGLSVRGVQGTDTHGRAGSTKEYPTPHPLRYARDTHTLTLTHMYLCVRENEERGSKKDTRSSIVCCFTLYPVQVSFKDNRANGWVEKV